MFYVEKSFLLFRPCFNRIVHMTPPPSGSNFLAVPLVGTLDASWNLMRRLPKTVLEFISPSLRNLDLSGNRLVSVERLPPMSLLQTLRMSKNVIRDLDKKAFLSLTSLQV